MARARKQAFFMTPRDGGVLAFAGIWARWTDLVTCSIVTVPAVGPLAGVHARMPLVLPPDRWRSWLSGPGSDDLLVPPPEGYLSGLEIRPVGPAVGDVRNDGPGLIARLPDEAVAALPGTSPGALDRRVGTLPEPLF